MESINPLNNMINPAELIANSKKADMDPKLQKEDKDLKEFSQGFETLMLNKLFDEMEKTIDDSGLMSGSTSGQIRGLYWMFMAEEMSKQGGIGIGDEVYKQLSEQNTRKLQAQPEIDQKA